MYEDFAQVYDALMSEIDYKEWSDYIFRLMLNSQKEVKSILEFGCGTGNITLELAKKGFDMTAVDLSENMLTVADEKAEEAGLNNIRFYLGDMSNFAIQEKFDAVISCCDCVNYLSDLEAFNNFISCSIDALKPGGILAFDMNTKSKYHDVIKDRTFVYDLDDIFCVWENDPHFDEKYMDFDLSFFVQRKDGLYERFDEVQKQYIYMAEDIFHLLKRPDLKDVKIYNFGTFLAGGNENDRIQFIAEKR